MGIDFLNALKSSVSFINSIVLLDNHPDLLYTNGTPGCMSDAIFIIATSGSLSELVYVSPFGVYDTSGYLALHCRYGITHIPTKSIFFHVKLYVYGSYGGYKPIPFTVVTLLASGVFN